MASRRRPARISAARLKRASWARDGQDRSGAEARAFNSHTEPARLPFCHRISDLPSVEIAYGGRMQARPGVAEIGASYDRYGSIWPEANSAAPRVMPV